MKNFREMPIVLKVLDHTGNVDGDDGYSEKLKMKYRDVKVCDADTKNPDPLVVINDEMRCMPIYSGGAARGITPYYGTGIGAPSTVLVRKPVLQCLRLANDQLRPFSRMLLVLDGWRPADVQVGVWGDVRSRRIEQLGLKGQELTVQQEVEIGDYADNIGSFCAVVKNEKFEAEVKKLEESDRWGQVMAASEALNKPILDVVELYLTFLANRGAIRLDLNNTVTTAHGNGGATDLFLIDFDAKPVCLGVPFDFDGEAARMDWFEDEDNLDPFKKMIMDRPDLCEYLIECGVTRFNRDTFNRIRDERRMLYWACVSVGATIYVNEPWHFNWPCREGGKLAMLFPDAGNGCQSFLKNVRDPEGQLIAVWGNDTGNRLANEILARESDKRRLEARLRH